MKPLEAMKQALVWLGNVPNEEQLSLLVPKINVSGREIYHNLSGAIQQMEKEEPVAWLHKQGEYVEAQIYSLEDDEIARGWEQFPLYLHPQEGLEK